MQWGARFTIYLVSISFFRFPNGSCCFPSFGSGFLCVLPVPFRFHLFANIFFVQEAHQIGSLSGKAFPGEAASRGKPSVRIYTRTKPIAIDANNSIAFGVRLAVFSVFILRTRKSFKSGVQEGVTALFAMGPSSSALR